MQDYKHLKIEIENEKVFKIFLNRPNIHNAFNEELMAELIDCFLYVEQNKKIRLITLEGKGKSFCAGADLNWMKKMKDYSEEENRKDSLKLAELFITINKCHIPVLGFVHGAAIGGGSGLVSVCDYVLCKENTKFGFSEVRLGLLPAVISPFVISKIKESFARAFFLSGAIFDEKTALNMGLIHQICDQSSWEECKMRLIKSFLKAAPKAAIEAKTLIRNVLEISSRETLLEYTSSTIARIRTGQEAQEGMSALLEKKSPKWLGEIDA